MKQLLVILFLIPSIGFGAITRVQSKVANSGNGLGVSSLTITLDAATTAGNALVIGYVLGTDVPLRIKHGSNSLVFETNVIQSTGPEIAHICYMPVVEASTTIVFTVGGGSSSKMAAIAVEYAGTKIVPDIPPLGATGSSTTNTTGTLAATRYANELIVGVMGTRGTFASEQTAWLSSPTNSFSSIVQTSNFSNSSNTDRAIAILERIVTSTGTYSTAGTQANTAWVNLIASFTDNPTPTPTATSTPTATATSTATPTSTATATPSATVNCPVVCPTATATPSATYTPTATASATFTPTATATPSATINCSVSCPTATATPSATFTPTATASSTATPTATASATSTPTPTPPIESSYGFQG